MKVNTIVVATIGLDRGKIKSKKILTLFDPSICIASSYSFGIEEKNWVKRNILNTEITLGRMTARIENTPFSPSICLTIEYKGIMLVSTGTTIRNNIMKLKNPLPGKLNLASTYPAKPLTMTLKNMTIIA